MLCIVVLDKRKDSDMERSFIMSILKTVELKKYYGSSENEVHALNGVNFSVEEGEFVSIVGTGSSHFR